MNLKQTITEIEKCHYIKESSAKKYHDSIKTYFTSYGEQELVSIPWAVSNIGVIGGVLICPCDEIHETLQEHYYLESDDEGEDFCKWVDNEMVNATMF